MPAAWSTPYPPPALQSQHGPSATPLSYSTGHERRHSDATGYGAVSARRSGRSTPAAHSQPALESPGATFDVVAQLDLVERSGGGGILRIGSSRSLRVSHLDRVFFPETRETKGDLARYYARMAPYILPLVADRALILQRYPDGVAGEAFFQQRVPPHPPRGVRVAPLATAEGKRLPRLIGGSLITLLYTVQLGTIAVNPWLSRVRAPANPDHAVIDLDPGEGVQCERVLEVALLVRHELDALGLHAAVKSSGGSGVHIYLPLPRGVDYGLAARVTLAVAARVARAHPRAATLERAVRARPRGSVYLDVLQNMAGKSVAAAYSVRARPVPTVSTPLRWEEVERGVDVRSFTMERVPARVARVGDLWAEAMAQPNGVRALRDAAAEAG